jgi:hypothetical protein
LIDLYKTPTEKNEYERSKQAWKGLNHKSMKWPTPHSNSSRSSWRHVYLILESRSRAQLHVLCNLGPAAIHPHHLHLATTNCVAAHHQPYLTLTQIFQTNPIPYLVSTMLHRWKKALEFSSPSTSKTPLVKWITMSQKNISFVFHTPFLFSFIGLRVRGII